MAWDFSKININEAQIEIRRAYLFNGQINLKQIVTIKNANFVSISQELNIAAYGNGLVRPTIEFTNINEDTGEVITDNRLNPATYLFAASAIGMSSYANLYNAYLTDGKNLTTLFSEQIATPTIDGITTNIPQPTANNNFIKTMKYSGDSAFIFNTSTLLSLHYSTTNADVQYRFPNTPKLVYLSATNTITIDMNESRHAVFCQLLANGVAKPVKPVIEYDEINFKVYIDANSPESNLSSSIGIRWNTVQGSTSLTNFELRLAIRPFGGMFPPASESAFGTIITVPYSTGYYTTSYLEIIKNIDPELYSKLATGDARVSAQAQAGLIIKAYTDFSIGDTVYDSGWFGFNTWYWGFDSDTCDYGEYGAEEHHGSIEVFKGQLNLDDVYPDFPPRRDDIPNVNPTFNSVNIGTHCYLMSKARVNNLANALWLNDFIDNIKLVNNNPIENVVALKLFPLIFQGGDDTTVKIGNVDTGVSAAELASTTQFKYTLASGVRIPKKYDNFLDYAPYTNAQIFLPFVGIVDIDVNLLVDNAFNIVYDVDVITGNCTALIMLTNGTIVSKYNCNLGIDIPLTASNRASYELALLNTGISSATSFIGDIATGNIVGAVGDVANGVMSGLTQPFHSSTNGVFSSTTALYESMHPYLLINRPKYQELAKFNHTFGKMCNLSLTLGTLKGYTVIDSNTDLTGIDIPEDERKKLLDILSSGFYC